MKRSHISVFFLGILVAVVSNHALSLICPTKEARADIPAASADKVYPLTFAEYLQLYCMTFLTHKDDTNSFTMKAVLQRNERGSRIRILGTWGTLDRNSALGRMEKGNVDLRISNLKSQIKYWKSLGYDISESDIVIDSALK